MDSNTRTLDPQSAPSLAGGPTTEAPLASHSPTTIIDSRPPLNTVVRCNSNGVALALIALGILLFFGHANLTAAFGAAVPLSIGLVFLYVYSAQQRNVGFLIPGAILTGLGLGGFVGMLLGLPSLIGVGLGLGFCAIWYQAREHWWALIPGGILILAGLAVLTSSYLFAGLLPALLVLAGGGLLVSGRVARRRG